MKKFLLAVIAATPLLIGAASVPPSIDVLSGEIGTCTAFSVDQRMSYWLTAAHCRMPQLWVGDTEAAVVRVDEQVDLMLLKAHSAPALKVARNGLRVGDEVRLTGFPRGEGPYVFFGHVSVLNYAVGNGRYRMILHEGGGPGMSGAPITRNGEVVGVVSALRDFPSILLAAVTPEQIRAFLAAKN